MGFLGLIIVVIVAVVLWLRMNALQRQLSALRDDLAARPSPAGRFELAAMGTEASPQETEPMSTIDTGAPSASAGMAGEQLQEVQALREPDPRRAISIDFENLFGRLLPIWAGGVTLAVAGFFLVRWSIDAGLLTPGVRVALAGLFGVALVAAAELAYRWRERVADPRVAQALAGAGLATLYAAFYLAGSAYGLIGSTFAFIGLAAVTAAAIGLSFRFGLPSAVLGLVGGFAAPALVGSEEANLPLLTLYLAMVTAGLAFTGRRQDRAWIGTAALGGGLGWGGLLLATDPGGSDAIVLGAYLVFLAGVLPALAGGSGRPHWLVRVGAAGFGALQLAILVQQGGFGGFEWGLYLLLGAALAWFGWREPAVREGKAFAAAVGIALLPFWLEPSVGGFAAVATGLAAIFAGVPLVQLWRGHGRALDIVQATGVALGLGLAGLGHFGSPLPGAAEPGMALGLLALASLPVAAAFVARQGPHRSGLMGAQAVAALLFFAALAQILPQNALAWSAAAATALVAWRWRKLTGVLATWAALAALWALLPLSDWLESNVLALAGSPMPADALPSPAAVVLRIMPAVVAGAALTFATLSRGVGRTLGAIAIVLATIAVHVLFRRAFAAAAGSDFITTGVIERAAWETLLLSAAGFAWIRGWRHAAIAFAVAALAHFGWFALVLHNPLWSDQAVGPLPIANGLLPAYAAGLAALLLLRGWLPAAPPYLRWLIDAGLMLGLSLLALSELRHAFSGALLNVAPISPTEDLLRSLLGIVLAVGFLLWGSTRGERSWRIGSLALMLIAVLKVFLVDAAGLEGLARIASFMALGFSLIGIGWFYNRQLRAPHALPTA